MAKCRDAVEDQLLYSETRLEDINELENQLLSSQKVSIKDICRFFHGAGSSFARGGKWRAGLVVALGAVDALEHQQAILTKKKGTGRSSWKRKKKLSSVSFQKHEQTYKIVQGTALTGWWFTKTCIGI